MDGGRRQFALDFGYEKECRKYFRALKDAGIEGNIGEFSKVNGKFSERKILGPKRKRFLKKA